MFSKFMGIVLSSCFIIYAYFEFVLAVFFYIILSNQSLVRLIFYILCGAT